MATKHDSWARNSDEWLAGVVQAADRDDRDVAMHILWDRYQAQLLGYASHQLGGDHYLAEDTAQQIWLEFEKRVRLEGVKQSARTLLFTIAKRRCIDALRNKIRKQQTELNIENNMPGEKDIEEAMVEQEVQESISRMLFTHPMLSRLSHCERAVWMLRAVLDYKTPMVTRLMNKSRGTIYTTLHNTAKELERYRKSQDYELDLVGGSMSTSEGLLSKKPKIILDWFMNALEPQFTDDELHPLYVTAKELHDGYRAHLLLPWEFQSDKLSELPNVFLLLTSSTYKMTSDLNIIPKGYILEVNIKEETFRLELRFFEMFIPQALKDTLTFDGKTVAEHTYYCPQTYLVFHTTGKVEPMYTAPSGWFNFRFSPGYKALQEAKETEKASGEFEVPKIQQQMTRGLTRKMLIEYRKLLWPED